MQPTVGDEDAKRASEAMDRYASGDDAAFGDLYDALAPRLHGFLLRLTSDATRAEDLLQQTFLQIHDARFRFVSGSDVAPWAMAIARRLFIDSLRSAKRHRDVPVDSSVLDETVAAADPSPEEWVWAEEMAEVIAARLRKLPASHREAFQLVKQEGLTHAEAADVLGITVAAVKVRAHRAYVQIRAAVLRAKGAK